MTTVAIELNDAEIRVVDASGVVAQEPAESDNFRSDDMGCYCAGADTGEGVSIKGTRASSNFSGSFRLSVKGSVMRSVVLDLPDLVRPLPDCETISQDSSFTCLAPEETPPTSVTIDQTDIGTFGEFGDLRNMVPGTGELGDQVGFTITWRGLDRRWFLVFVPGGAGSVFGDAVCCPDAEGVEVVASGIDPADDKATTWIITADNTRGALLSGGLCTEKGCPEPNNLRLIRDLREEA